MKKALKNKEKKLKLTTLGFTLIELLAVIIILAVIALIATPVVLKVVDQAKESARKSSVTGYADAIRLAINEKMFENKGSTPTIDNAFLSSIIYQGESVSCNNVVSSNNYGVILHECTVGSNTNLYCYLSGKVYNCDDDYYTNIYNNLENNSVEYTDSSGANAPVLYDNMIPVYYDGTNWKYADIYNDAWYDYDLKDWANAVVLVSSPSTTYNVGDAISMSDISQMYVWIPRYKYTIFNGTGTSGVAVQEINVVFESGTAKTGTVSCMDNVSGSGTSSETCTDTTNGTVTNGTSTYTHPAFTFGTTELTGLWVGKFETGSVTTCTPATGSITTGCDLTTLGIQVKPNIKSWRGARVSTYFTAISNIASTYSINADSHMMKNMEWGAVAYLKSSKYGLSTTDIGINNNSTYTTGCGAIAGTASNPICNTYDTDNGKLASTTGNTYGVYDMSGGALEYIMGDMVTSNNVPMVGNDSTHNSGFTGMLYNGTSFTEITFPTNEYYELYTYDTSNKIQSTGKLGDATKETLLTYGSSSGGWYSDYSNMPFSSYSWFVRGGGYSNTSYAGILSFDYNTGAANIGTSTRVVLSGLNQ